MSDWISDNWKWIAGIVGAGFLKPLIDFIKGRRTERASARAIDITSDRDLYQISEADAKEYRELFKQAEVEIRKSRRHWMNAEFLIRRMLNKMQTANIDGWQDDQAAFEKMLEEMK